MGSPERWKRVQELFDQLEGLQGEQWRVELERIEESAEVRGEVIRLFDAIRAEEKAQAEAGAHRRERQADPVVATELDWDVGQPGLRLISLIGAGGAGSVFKAVRWVNGVEQMVAVKVYHEHRATEEDQERFLREQRVLATLTDPGIVRFFDAGLTPDGRPYLVMELAEGQHITRHCDERKIDIEARIELLLAVCRAVQSAHSRLIVHLDLKPSNLLVTPEGDIKLLDFGTARWIDHSQGGVVTQQLTPQYASPERLRGEPATVASDIYGLGMILFELVSGGSPFPKQSSIVGVAERAGGRTTATELDEAVTAEGAAQRATTLEKLRRQLKGDLASICRKALAFEADQRYGSVNELAADLRRYLRGEPVEAHEANFSYRTAKFVKRYWARLALAGGISVALVGMAAYSWMQARNTRIALERAETGQIFLGNLLTWGRDKDTVTMPQLIELAQRRLAGLSSQDLVLAADLEASLAMARQPGDALYLKSAENALQLARSSGDVTREAVALLVMGDHHYATNQPEAAWKEFVQALELWKQNKSKFSPARAAGVLGNAGKSMAYVRPYDLSVREPLAACLELTEKSHRVPQYLRQECLVGQAISYLYGSQEYEKALPLLQEVVTWQRAMPGPSMELAEALQLLGLAYRFLGRYSEDEQALRECYGVTAKVHGADSLYAANARAVWAASLDGTGKTEEALREIKAALAIYRRVYPQRAVTLLYTPLSVAMRVAYRGGRYAESEEYGREALEALGKAPAEKDVRLLTARAYLGLALAQRGVEKRDGKRQAEARPLLESALRMSRELPRPTRQQLAMRKEMEEALGKLP